MLLVRIQELAFRRIVAVLELPVTQVLFLNEPVVKTRVPMSTRNLTRYQIDRPTKPPWILLPRLPQLRSSISSLMKEGPIVPICRQPQASMPLR